MKIETLPLENHQIKITLEIDAEAMEKAKQTAARRLAKRVKIPGFRPGKAPYPIILRQLGDAVVAEEALEVVVDDYYSKMIEDAGIKAFGPGKLEKIVSMDPPVLEFVIPLAPEVILGDYKSIRKPYEPKSVDEEDVTKALEELRERQAILEPVERPAQEGDLVSIRIKADRLQPDEDGDKVLIPARSMPFVIHSEDNQEEAPEWPFPGFSRHLIGLKADDEKVFQHTFSPDTQSESLRGVESEFHIKVENVKSRTLPDLDDEFASSVGEFDSLQALQDEVRHSLEHQIEDEYNETYDKAILEDAVEMSSIHYPPQMLESEIDNVITRFKSRLESSRVDLDVYLKSRNISMEDLRNEARPAADTRLKQSLVLFELAKSEEIKVEPHEVEQETKRTLDILSNSLSQKEMRRFSNQDVFSNMVSNIMTDMVTQRAIERLREIARGAMDEVNIGVGIESYPTPIPSQEVSSPEE